MDAQSQSVLPEQHVDVKGPTATEELSSERSNTKAQVIDLPEYDFTREESRRVVRKLDLHVSISIMHLHTAL